MSENTNPAYAAGSEEGGVDEDPRVDAGEVDLQALAEAVYALLQQELRLERERRGWC